MVMYPIYLALLLTLSGCTTKEFHLGWYDKCLPKTVDRIVKVYPDVDTNRTTCNVIPLPDAYTKQSEVAEYVVNLFVSGKECRDNLLYVAEEIKEP